MQYLLFAHGRWPSRQARPKNPEPAQALTIITIAVSVIGALLAVWPAFRQLAAALIQIAVLYFMTGMRG